MRRGDDFRSHGGRARRATRRPGSLLLNIVGGTAVAFVTLACGAAVYAHVFAPPDAEFPAYASSELSKGVESTSFSDRFALASFAERFAPAMNGKGGGAEALAVAAAIRSSSAAARGAAVALLDPRYALGGGGAMFTPPAAPAEPEMAQDLPLEVPPPVMPQVAANIVPMPLARPATLQLASLPETPPQASLPQTTRRGLATQGQIETLPRVAAPAKAEPNIFQKLFGLGPVGNALAYAPSDGGVASDGQPSLPGRYGRYDRYTAVYDISARMVYLPDGSKLEAHSGLGEKMDDPRFVHVKMQGATPPHVYELTPREKLFHGVEALRMHPVEGAQAIHGRTGLLTHSYMLGPTGASNGCVSFKDYQAFLNAYKSGQVKRLVVVAKLD